MKELRFGLVCYGGVSLAIYMHGITSELHNLVKASNAQSNGAGGRNPFPENTTEHIYFEILNEIAAEQPLRVIVDVIAGTSAGGINGVALAKALAHDLDQAPLKQVWFDKASILKLLSPWKLLRGEAILNGDRMLRWVYEALDAMNATAKAADASLMPEGHKLDLYVTLTDCTGYRRTIDIHDPIAIFDREHRHVLNFSYDPAEQIDHFGPRFDPGLTLAIRCTSSFPVAFGPVNLNDISAVAKSWAPEDRDGFIATAFAQYALENAKLASAYFIDGGVLNNRPFNHAVQAILERPAKHEVDRRLLFIEPHPEPPPVDTDAEDTTRRPRLAQTARAALMSIPSQQPIADALLELARYNQRVLQIKHLIQVLKPKVDDVIQAVTKAHVHDLGVPEWTQLEAWRDEIRKRAEAEAGAGFHSYAALKINAVLEHLAAAICRLLHYPAGSRQAILVARVVPAWAERAGIVTGMPDLTPTQCDFLQTFDLDYRRRRLRFLVEYVNQLYPPSPITAPLPPREQVDRVKAELYALMAELQVMSSGAWLDESTLRQLSQVFGRGAIETADGGPAAVAAFLKAHDDTITSIVAELEAGLKRRLESFNERQAKDLAELANLNWAQSIIGDLRARYLGFAYWDLLLYPIQALSEIAELDTIEVTRISPEDTTALEPKGTTQRLEGVALGHFGAFLRRSYRENDFLWGRLDGVERLFSILCDASGERKAVDPRLMWRGFQAVLDTEAPHMRSRASRDLLASVRAQVDHQLARSEQPPGPAPVLPITEAAD